MKTTTNRQVLMGRVHAQVKPFGMTLATKVFAVLLAVVLFVGSAVACVSLDLLGRLRNAVLDTSNLGASVLDSDLVNDPFEGRAVNLLVSGVDSRTDQDENIVNSSSGDVTMRSDTTLLVHISGNREGITVVSIPRDLLVTIPSCTLSDGTTTYESYSQFNWAFSYGAGTDDVASGIACTQATTELLTGIPIDGFVVIDFTGFTELVDALGTVEICTDEYINDSHTGLQLEAGCHELDKYEALAYARVRYNVGDGSDVSRIGRQQQLLSAMMSQILDTNMLTELGTLYSFIREALGTVYVSTSLSDLKQTVSLANSLRSISHENIRFVTMPTTTAVSDPNRLDAYEPYATQLWDSLVFDTYLPAGVIYSDLDGSEYTMGEAGIPQEGTDQIGHGVGTYLTTEELAALEEAENSMDSNDFSGSSGFTGGSSTDSSTDYSNEYSNDYSSYGYSKNSTGSLGSATFSLFGQRDRGQSSIFSLSGQANTGSPPSLSDTLSNAPDKYALKPVLGERTSG